jgi:hypothetical protein
MFGSQGREKMWAPEANEQSPLGPGGGSGLDRRCASCCRPKPPRRLYHRPSDPSFSFRRAGTADSKKQKFLRALRAAGLYEPASLAGDNGGQVFRILPFPIFLNDPCCWKNPPAARSRPFTGLNFNESLAAVIIAGRISVCRPCCQEQHSDTHH